MAVILLALAAAALNPEDPAPAAAATELSVMSYNVHGLPWPIAKKRTRALRAIGERLETMRLKGEQPHLVLLQEAFTSEAKSIALKAGYPYAVEGPGRRDRTGVAAVPARRPANRLKGEGNGTLTDSGLLVLSDYPVIDVKRLPYARFSCAGFDCLANKGMVLVRLALPGASQPLTVVDTHMNSRGASGVRKTSADAAYGWQAEQLRAFVGGNVPATVPAIVAGDFNIGKTEYRRDMITGNGGVLAGSGDALRTALGQGLKLADQAAAETIVTRGKDWMFARNGCSTRLVLRNVTVPFGTESNGRSLSDHFGYVAHYDVENGPTTCA